jgi:hypothetical protein
MLDDNNILRRISDGSGPPVFDLSVTVAVFGGREGQRVVDDDGGMAKQPRVPRGARQWELQVRLTIGTLPK